jgi:hypothetical protein
MKLSSFTQIGSKTLSMIPSCWREEKRERDGDERRKREEKRERSGNERRKREKERGDERKRENSSTPNASNVVAWREPPKCGDGTFWMTNRSPSSTSKT